MTRLLPVPVEDCRDLAGPTGAASATLAELGTRLGGNADLGHGGTAPWLLSDRDVALSDGWAGDREGGRWDSRSRGPSDWWCCRAELLVGGARRPRLQRSLR